MRLVEIAPRARGRFRLSFDDGSRLTATENEFVRFGLYAGMTLSDSVAERLRAACAESAARERAARLAAARPLSKMELERKLIRKGQSAPAAEAAADWLESLGALHAAADASEVVRPYAGRGYGPMKLRAERRVAELRAQRGKRAARALGRSARAGAGERGDAAGLSRIAAARPGPRAGGAAPPRRRALSPGICMGGHRACPG
jgi:hypothetical protein